MAEPVTKCGVCEQEDDHPKHQIMYGGGKTLGIGDLFHPYDFEKNGMIYVHFHCPSDFHNIPRLTATAAAAEAEKKAAEAAADPDNDELAGHAALAKAAADEAHATATRHEAICALAKSGVRGEELRARILGGEK
jgi:hypothetical protein